ncbi:MAG: UrcA family protein [Hellea sp.]
MLKTKIALTLLLAFAASGMMLVPSVAADTAKTQSYDVRYNPNELASPDSAENIIRRVHVTASELCWDEIGPERYTEKLKAERCLREVTQDLVDRIGHRNLDIAHAKLPAPRKLVKPRINTQWAKLGSSAP